VILKAADKRQNPIREEDLVIVAANQATPVKFTIADPPQPG
jgi:hypothetical protein